MAKTGDKPRRRGRGKKLSRMVTLRMKDAQALVDSIRSRKAAVAAALRQRLAPTLREGETPPDHELPLELRARAVEAAIARLVKLDDRRDYARTHHGLAAREVDRLAKKELYPEASDVRREIEAAFGREVGAPLHAFRGKTTRVPTDLMLRIAQLLPRLEDPDGELPTRTLRGEPVDREGWIRRLRKPLEQLTEADEHLRRCASRLTNLGLDRKQAMQEYDALYADTLRLVEAELREAGLGEQILNELRAYYQRRRLRRRARTKRKVRAGRRPAAVPEAAASAETPPEPEAPPAEEHDSPEGAAATVSRALRKTRVLG